MRARGVAATAVIVLAHANAYGQRTQGTFVQSDTLGMNMVSYNFDTGKTTGVGDVAGLSEFAGLHYYFIDNFRVGLNLQFTEYLTDTSPNQSRFATFALLPQIGWHFWGPLFMALVFTIAPWTLGGKPVPPSTTGSNNFDLGFQFVFGGAIPLAKGVSLTLAGEVPYNFLVYRTIGFTPLVGVSIRLGCAPCKK